MEIDLGILPDTVCQVQFPWFVPTQNAIGINWAIGSFFFVFHRESQWYLWLGLGGR